jgi:hypothetical protein
MMVISIVACGNSQSSINSADTEVESSEAINSETGSTEQTESSDTEVEALSPKKTPKVYMTTDINPEGLMAAYKALKLDTGRKGCCET